MFDFWQKVKENLHRQGVENVEEMIGTWKKWIERAIREGVFHIKKQWLNELKSEELLLLQYVLTQYGLTIKYECNVNAHYFDNPEREWYEIISVFK